MPPQEDKCSSCDVIRDGFVPVVKLEEKRSDVNLAVSLADAAKMILTEAREYHVHGRWRLALMLVMPDPLHFIVQVSGDGAHGVRHLPPATSGTTRTLPVAVSVVSDFSHDLEIRQTRE